MEKKVFRLRCHTHKKDWYVIGLRFYKMGKHTPFGVALSFLCFTFDAYIFKTKKK